VVCTGVVLKGMGKAINQTVVVGELLLGLRVLSFVTATWEASSCVVCVGCGSKAWARP
jgi:hypothetical protein